MNYSVIIPVYNAENFLKGAVNSALRHQEVKEVILVEDGSKDCSLAVCKELVLEDNRVKLFQHPNGENRGAGASRNLGMKKATQTILAFLDADDYFLPNRFEVEKQVFLSNPDVDGIYGALGTQFFEENAQKVKTIEPDNQNTTTTSKKIPSEKLFEHLIGIRKYGEGYFSIVTLSLKAQAIKDSAILFNETLRLHQDSDFIWKLAYCLKLLPGEINEPIATRGVHHNNRYNSKSDNINSFRLQFKSAILWAKEDNLPEEYVRHFKMKYHAFLLKKISRKNIFLFIREMADERNGLIILYHMILLSINRLGFNQSK